MPEAATAAATVPAAAGGDRGRRLRDNLDLLLAVALFAGGALWLSALPVPARFDADEGLNLMKARLVADGYRLYRDIWNDQPPLFTWMLLGWSRAFGDSLAASRSLVLACAALLLLATSRLVRLTVRAAGGANAGAAGNAFGDHGPAVLAGLLAMSLLLGSRGYVKLMVSVMIGLPAIALAVTSLWLLAASCRARSAVAATSMALVSGALMGASMQVKLFTFMALPAAAALLAPAMRRAFGASEQRPAWPAITAWVAALAAVFLPLAMLSFGGRADQLLAPHVGSELSFARRLAENALEIVKFLAEDPVHAGAAALGLATALARHRGRAVFAPLLWLVTGTVALLLASPVWTHHRLMLYAPMAMLAGVGLTDLLLSLDVTRPWRRFALVLAAAALAVGAFRLVKHAVRFGSDGDPLDPRLVALLREDGGEDGHENGDARDGWVFTDHPLYAYVAGRRVPPELAVLSYKRIRSAGGPEGISPAMVDILRRYRPRLVLLARFDEEGELGLPFEQYLLRHYEPLPARPAGQNPERPRLFRRRPEATAPGIDPPVAGPPGLPSSRPTEARP